MSNRGASVRIPWQVANEKKGYIEDRRPNANMDPYVVTRLITDTVCSAALADEHQHARRASKTAPRSATAASRRATSRKTAARR